jgi:hypothetical protein
MYACMHVYMYVSCLLYMYINKYLEELCSLSRCVSSKIECIPGDETPSSSRVKEHADALRLCCGVEDLFTFLEATLLLKDEDGRAGGDVLIPDL